MHAGRYYSFVEVAWWTWRETLLFIVVATIPTLAWTLGGLTFLSIPWPPVALVGTAVAFVTGFKNNAAYARTWEARQIWGAIINTSRTWAMQVRDLPSVDVTRVLVERHLAWLTALRFQLREVRAWEGVRRNAADVDFKRFYKVEEWETDVVTALTPLLSADDLSLVKDSRNRAVTLLSLQSKALKALVDGGQLTDLRFVELQRAVAALTDCQGRCERIKNFPYPRQFTTLNLFFIWLLIVTLPLALMPELAKMGPHFVWATIPLAATVSWIFHMIDRIGEATENPFEGGANDVPITAMSRTIEIDLRGMLGDPQPAALTPTNNILM
jgi:putative membrane protein